jgi:NADH-quinone oxidoreductase subunit H
LLTGWSSNNKYTFIGGIRGALQMFAYEVPLDLSIIGVLVITRSLDLIQIAEAQSQVWFILIQPLGFIVFFISLLAELERIPFDIPSAESEISWGYFTEYTGIGYGLFMLVKWLHMYVGALLLTVLFLGGWNGPPFLPPFVWTIIKSVIVVFIMILIKCSFPRVRIDQVLRIGWKFLIPLAILNIFLTVVVMQLVPF